MQIEITDYDIALLKSIQAANSVFEDGNQRSVYSICDIREIDSHYIVSFRPPTHEQKDPITFEFLGSRMLISSEQPQGFSVAVRPSTQPIEARYVDGILQLYLPKDDCERLSL